jgi:hypothetical protein
VAYGQYAIKKLSVFEWHRRFKEGQEAVHVDPRSEQTKMQRADANVNRVHCTRTNGESRVLFGSADKEKNGTLA